MSVKFFEVGGCVRDEIMGVEKKDIDFSVEAPSFDDMRGAIVKRGGRIFQECPEFFTIRAHVPKMGAADFVLCRKDGEYKDGRHPESVEMGTLMDDLARRDFTMNAMAKDEDGKIIDPFCGRKHIEQNVIVCVGDTETRLREDALRIVRAIRFSVTKFMVIHPNIHRCLLDPNVVQLLENVSVERIREELSKAFLFDTVHTLAMLRDYPPVETACFQRGLKLMPTLKERF